LSWWEHFGRSYDRLPPWQFAYHFFTRSLTDAKLRRRDERFVASARERWRQVHGADPLGSPIDVADQRVPGRVVRVSDDAVQLPGGALPLRRGAADNQRTWGLRVTAPDTEAGLPSALDATAKGVAAGAALVAVGGGTALTRRLLTEAARLEHGAVSLLVDDTEPSRFSDVAETAILSGRTDLVGAPTGLGGQ
jgi:salicyloyl-CoA 5-hydroxylase